MEQCFELAVGKGRCVSFDILAFDAILEYLQYAIDETTIQIDLIFLFLQQLLLKLFLS